MQRMAIRMGWTCEGCEEVWGVHWRGSLFLLFTSIKSMLHAQAQQEGLQCAILLVFKVALKYKKQTHTTS
jgi:hypothetical protein